MFRCCGQFVRRRDEVYLQSPIFEGQARLVPAKRLVVPRSRLPPPAERYPVILAQTPALLARSQILSFTYLGRRVAQ
jgi:hypothetical protein